MASTEWERWNSQQHIICPFDPSHRITAARFQRHLLKCRKNFPNKDFVSCPFNASHQILRQHLKNHICQCPDKNVVEAIMNGSESLDKLRGDTSVPSYNTPSLYDVGDEDWDAEIAESQFYATSNVGHRQSGEPTRFEQQSLMGLKQQGRREIRQEGSGLQKQEDSVWT